MYKMVFYAQNQNPELAKMTLEIWTDECRNQIALANDNLRAYIQNRESEMDRLKKSQEKLNNEIASILSPFGSPTIAHFKERSNEFNKKNEQFMDHLARLSSSLNESIPNVIKQTDHQFKMLVEQSARLQNHWVENPILRELAEKPLLDELTITMRLETSLKNFNLASKQMQKVFGEIKTLADEWKNQIAKSNKAIEAINAKLDAPDQNNRTLVDDIDGVKKSMEGAQQKIFTAEPIDDIRLAFGWRDFIIASVLICAAFSFCFSWLWILILSLFQKCPK